MSQDTEWVVNEQPILFELRMPVPVVEGEPEKMAVLVRTPDEGAARISFDAVRKAFAYLKPRPQLSLELYLGTTVLDVFEQTPEDS